MIKSNSFFKISLFLKEFIIFLFFLYNARIVMINLEWIKSISLSKLENISLIFPSFTSGFFLLNQSYNKSYFSFDAFTEE